MEEEQQRVLSLLAGSQAQEDSTLRKEREVMLQLKEVVDRQRDKIRAQDHEIQCKGQDTEALQEQLNRFMAMNENLRRKLAIVQAQLGSALEKKAEMEALWEAERGSRAAAPLRTGATMEEEEGGAAVAPAPPEHLPGQRSFSKEELQQILQERNELKTSLFLVEEELAYYQRELLNDERVPALLLDAVKSAIKKQRKKIWAKMLGTEEEPTSREEEEEGEGWLTDPPGSDRTDGRLPESRIKSFAEPRSDPDPRPWKEDSREKTSPVLGLEWAGWPASSGRPAGNGRRGASARRVAAVWAAGRPARRAPGTMERCWAPLLLLLGLPGPGNGSVELEPGRRHVCRSADSVPPVLICCPGWKQVGPECPLALCLGADACREEEVCVRPAVCRCRPGFFGANCSARCPEQYWGPDCKQSCRCHPHGRCHPASGVCSCHPDWWGPLCQSACLCGQRGHCHPVTGTCQCEPGWWAPDCRRQCQCNLSGSRCDPVTGRCLCHRGWWGRRCASFCSCNGSPCAQESGRCECKAGWWGAACQHLCQCLHGTCAPQDGRCTCDAGYRGQSCTEPCPGGTYGSQCAHSCGHCRNQEPCSPTDGACLACDPGWNGIHCKQPCPRGLYGENCTQLCPRCRRGETCHLQTGECQNCEAGFAGARCETPCPPGFFGDGCQSPCPDCFHGSCDPVSGTCLCQAGYWGTSCNQTCPEAFHGPNCSAPCHCAGAPCHPLSGDCQWRLQDQEALLTGILGPLLLLLLLLLCCCCCCCRCGAASGHRAPGAEENPFSRAKHRVTALLPDLTSSLPCLSGGGSKLPRVTVAHRDPEIPFNPSFIEAASAAWPSDSSFASSSSDRADEEKGGCQGPQSALPPSEAPEDSYPPSLLPEAALHPSPFAIPRTSSIAKGKRPSVSFAEGTHFGPQSPRSPPEALNPTWKQKASGSTVQGVPPLQPSRSQEASCDSLGRSCYENVAPAPWEESCCAPACRAPGGHRSWAGGSRPLVQRVEALEAAAVETPVPGLSITTIYVTVGQAGRGSEGPLQHRGRGQEETTQPRSLQKLPCRVQNAGKDTPRKPAAEAGLSVADAEGLLAPDEADGGGSSGLEL
ncbi:scavenger receptor class F member 1 isoform X4 [Python bivittatus]|uniref:Scavenger receptor class F member 1 isoform X4 n=1 Tax=Python bivittatus TaxID=176946 RepID=A0A9F5N3G5_PYTBI|nr:scavenger receptor class F member 1 isoform X4 [Python bivittatus]